ncbi:MAG: MinD/ParA family protein [Corynebacterium sp.]|uniref:MinD/ParA family ATP-binding protein n=1 Tax=Corynebacterium sp. TaxID=1720 RepID=UPI0026E00547|nr:MinD/ParA family protein [Corynebacterium sp.]MDO5669797.1 MinD/ParA family protein [Corynebacterium sp.]
MNHPNGHDSDMPAWLRGPATTPPAPKSPAPDPAPHPAPQENPKTPSSAEPVKLPSEETAKTAPEEKKESAREIIDRLRTSETEESAPAPAAAPPPAKQNPQGLFTGGAPALPQPDPESPPALAPTIAEKKQPTAAFDLTPPPALDQSNLVNRVRRAPKGGWRRFVHTISGGHINPGESEKQLLREALEEQICAPLRGDYRIAVMSLKGGVGKTTTTVALGGIFATVRGDRVIAIDANPDLGTLAQRVAAPGPATIRDLLAAEDTSRYPVVRSYTTQARSRLEVIGSERDPAVSEAFSEEDYRQAIDILQHHYNVILTDCGTGLMHSAMSGVLDLANTLVLVTSPALDGAQSAAATLDWLNLHGYEQLAANAVVVISAANPGQATIDMEQLINHFRSRTRAVHVVPYDQHLSEGATIDMELLDRRTYQAYMELAAIVAEDFGSWHRHAAP